MPSTSKVEEDPALAAATTAYCDKLAAANTEHAHQRAVFAWIGRMAFLKRFADIDLAFAVPNGGKRDQITAARLKAEGVKPGVPDFVLPVPLHGRAGLLVEMKKNKTGRVSDEQRAYHARLQQQHYAVCVCWEWQQARDAIMDYYAGRPSRYDYGKKELDK